MRRVGRHAVALDDDFLGHEPAYRGDAVREPLPERARQVRGQDLGDIGQLEGVTGLPFQAGDLAAGDAARDHLVEPGQIGADVEGEPMSGDPAPDPDADRGQLAGAVDPDAGQAIHAVRPHAEAKRGGDDRRLQGADVAPQVQRVRQLDDGVGNQLARTMEGDVSSAVDAHQLGPERRHSLRRGQEVVLVAPSTDGVDRVVLQQEDAVADLTASPPVGQVVLELPCGSIGDSAEPLDGQDAAVTQQERAGAVHLPRAESRRSIRGGVRFRVRRKADVAKGGHGRCRGAVSRRQPGRGREPARRRGSWSAPAARTGRGRIPSRGRSGAGP